jgi:hypothetical protein
MPIHSPILFIFPFAFIVFIFLVLLLSKAIGKKAFLLIPLVVMLVPFLFLFQTRRVSRVSTVTLPMESAAPGLLGISETRAATSMTSAAPIWTEGIEDQFEADVYPSKEQATTALAGQASFLLSQVMESKTAPTAAIVLGDNDITVQLLNTFADELREQCGLAQVVVQTILPNTVPSEPNTATIILDMPKHQNQIHQRDSLTYAMGSGTLRTRIHGTSTKTLMRTAEFLEKPWVNNLGAVLNKHQDVTLAIARSNGTCTSQLEAQQQAMASVRSLVTQELQQLPRPHTVLTGELAVSDLDAKANELIVDRFTQSFRGTAGRIWRQAILLDLSQHKLNQMLGTKVRVARSRHRAVASRLGSLLGLALIVLILYIFLNAATKGYYTIALKIVAFVLVAVAIAAVVLG